MKKFLTLAACLTATALLNAQTTIHVTLSGTGDGTSWTNACNLETALQTAVSGDQIWVQGGRYYPSKMLVIPTSVEVYGGFAGTETNLSQRNFSANPTTIDGQHKIGSVFLLGKFSRLDGFTVVNGNSCGKPNQNGGGVSAEKNSIIENCRILNNTAKTNGGGIYAKGKLQLINSVVQNNSAGVSGADLYGNCIPPMMITHPDTTNKSTVKGGWLAALSVSAMSATPLSYQWFSNTTASNENGTHLGSDNGAQTAIFAPHNTIESALYYYCEITNTGGTTKSNVSGLYIIAPDLVIVAGCNERAFDFGEVGFETPTEYSITGMVDGEVLTQIWSDAVKATNCQKTTYTGGTSDYNEIDCRTNPDYPGDLFSWCAVAHFADVLCPAPWRAPTVDDFVNLDKALGRTGANVPNDNAGLPKYLGTGVNQWGGFCGGLANSDGTLLYQGVSGYYWTPLESSATTGRSLQVSIYGTIFPQTNRHKGFGTTLRCVK